MERDSVARLFYWGAVLASMRSRKVAWIVSVLVTGIASPGLFAADPTSASTPQDSKDIRAQYVSPATVNGWLNADAAVIVLDVRKAEEFHAGHLPNAINVVYDQVTSLADTLSHDHPIVLYCIHSTHRAPLAAKALNTLGFENAYVLEGGIVAWQAEGFTIQASNLTQTPIILPQPECICSETRTL